MVWPGGGKEYTRKWVKRVFKKRVYTVGFNLCEAQEQAKQIYWVINQKAVDSSNYWLRRESLGVMKMFLFRVEVSRVCIIVRTHQSKHLWFVHLLYVNCTLTFWSQKVFRVLRDHVSREKREMWKNWQNFTLVCGKMRPWWDHHRTYGLW